jgi:hypothetical protein
MPSGPPRSEGIISIDPAHRARWQLDVAPVLAIA